MQTHTHNCPNLMLTLAPQKTNGLGTKNVNIAGSGESACCKDTLHSTPGVS